MNSTVAICTMVVSAAVWIVLSTTAPWVLSDQNNFLAGFVTHEFLGFMGVVVTITLASAANLHIELLKCEESVEQELFTETKRHIKHSALALIFLLVLSVISVVVKPLLPDGEYSQSLVNGFALLIIIASVLTLIDLTLSAFALRPKIR